MAGRLRIAVDARPAAFAERTGVGEYTWQLLRRLPDVDPGSDYVAWYLRGRDLLRRPEPLADLPPSALRRRWTPLPSRWFEILSQRYELPRLEWLARFDVLFAPNFVPPPTRSRRVVVTVHDLAFAIMPETAPHGTRRWLGRFGDSVRRAARVIAVSEATRRDLLERFDVEPERVVTIHHGVDADALGTASDRDDSVLRRLGVRRPYFLFLGGIEPRKNLDTLVRAFHASHGAHANDATLVIAGGGVAWNPEGRAALDAALAAVDGPTRERIVLTGYVRAEDKAALLRNALALTYPSRYEGFGLPVLEAMAVGTPVLTSNTSALPEVAGDAALLVDPHDAGAVAAAMDSLASDEALRERLAAAGRTRARGFTWTETARRTAEVLRSAAGD